MKKFEITKEQILQLNSYNNYDCGVALKQWFPDAFQSEVEVGKWYKHNKFLLYIVDETHWYGFDGCGAWSDYVRYDCLMTDKYLLPATDKEVETALIAEAKRRGFKDAVKFNVDWEIYGKKEGIMQDSMFKLNNNSFGFQTLCQIGQPWIFCNGKWAEIISEPIELTLEQRIERIEEQLKIKK